MARLLKFVCLPDSDGVEVGVKAWDGGVVVGGEGEECFGGG